MVFEACVADLSPELSQPLQEASWQLAWGESKKIEGLKLVSNQKTTFGTMGSLLRAWSLLHCHGVWVLRHRPGTGAVEEDSQL